MKHYAVALVYAWLLEHPEHYSAYVRGYTQLRYSPSERRLIATRVAGHYRRRADWASVLPSLACTCRFERLATPKALEPPLAVSRHRYDADGEFVPRRYRIFVWQ